VELPKIDPKSRPRPRRNTILPAFRWADLRSAVIAAENHAKLVIGIDWALHTFRIIGKLY
jgi:hypothetical protein